MSPLLANLAVAEAAKAAPKGAFFVDDAVLIGDSLEDTKIEEVIVALRKYGLLLKPSKFKILKKDGV